MAEVTSTKLSASKYWVGFSSVHGIGPMKFRALLNHFGDLEEAWHADTHELKEAGLDQRALSNFMTSRSTISLDEEMVNLVKFQGAYDASAKLISTTDELIQTVLGMI